MKTEIKKSTIFKLVSSVSGKTLCHNNALNECLAESDFDNEEDFYNDIITFSTREEAQEYIDFNGYYALNIVNN